MSGEESKIFISNFLILAYYFSVSISGSVSKRKLLTVVLKISPVPFIWNLSFDGVVKTAILRGVWLVLSVKVCQPILLLMLFLSFSLLRKI